MKFSVKKIIVKAIIIAAIICLLMFNDNKDIQYIYANF
jgi:hypothetical protein